jgi:type IV pilus assembly protein PilV
MKTPLRQQDGVTLLEILVAILIISFGLLGTAGLQAVGLRASVSANQRTASTLLAYDAADRMRANMVGVAAGNYHNYTATQNTNCLALAGCTPAQMAQHDMYEWNVAIAAALPQGVGIVCRDSSADDGSDASSLTAARCDGLGNQYVVKIWWLEDRSTTFTSTTCPAGTAWSVTLSACLKRFATAIQP